MNEQSAHYCILAVCISIFMFSEPVLAVDALRPASGLERHALQEEPQAKLDSEGFERIREATAPLGEAGKLVVRLGAGNSAAGYLVFRVIRRPGKPLPLLSRFMGEGVSLEITFKDRNGDDVPGMKPYLLKKDGAVCRIGRAKDSDMVLPEGVITASRNHLEVGLSGDRIFFMDQGATHGTFVFGSISHVKAPEPLGEATATVVTSRGRGRDLSGSI